MNKVTILGRLVRQPVLKKLASGSQYVGFILAVPRKPFKDKPAGVDFIPCIAWNRLAETIYTNFNKGQAILVSGSWRSDKYVKDGVDIYVHRCLVEDFDFIGSKADNLRFNPTFDKSSLNDDITDTSLKHILESFKIDDSPIDFFEG